MIMRTFIVLTALTMSTPVFPAGPPAKEIQGAAKDKGKDDAQDADSGPDKIVGTWHGSLGQKDIYSLQFSSSSFNMEIDGCEVSGSYKISEHDELLLTPRAIDRTRQSSPCLLQGPVPGIHQR